MSNRRQAERKGNREGYADYDLRDKPYKNKKKYSKKDRKKIHNIEYDDTLD